MAIEVKRKDKETTISLLRRFVRRVQLSGILVNARKARFYEKKKSKRKIRESALRREKLRQLRERLLKTGQLREGELVPKEQIRKYLED